MNMSSMRGVFLSVLVFSIGFAVIPSVYAESVSAKSVAFEETTIIEFTNEGTKDVSTFRIWLGSDFSFKSFKTEEGWKGEKTPQGVIIFTSSEPVKPGESIKFGVKTDKISSGINWKALDKTNKEIEIGKSIAGELKKPDASTKPIAKTTSEKGVLTDSIFRIIPEKPNVGGTIRVTGDNFGETEEFDFYVDSKKIGSFVTNDAGHFMTTMKIPKNIDADRVDFKVKDKQGGEKKISLRLGGLEDRVPESDNIRLTIKGLPNVMHRGDMLEISGTGQPGSAITAKISNPEGEIINTRTAEVDSKGNWKLDEPILVPLDTPFGKYSAEITDGRSKLLKNWSVESDKVIIISPESLKFEPGSPMRFNGTALPNEPIELILEDPLGDERFSNIIEVDETGFVELEYPTIANVDKEGTWTLIATQGKNKEFIFAGLGQLPTIPVNLEFDKLNYKSSETAIITLTGKPSELLSMLIIDPSDKPKGETIPIKLKPDGRTTYELELDGYASGVYTAVVSKGATKNSEIFTVGLQVGSGDIHISTTKLEYSPGDSILILGDTNPNVLLTVTLFDPSGKEVKVKETFSNKNGKISEDGFRIPSGAEPGKWKIKAVSGSNFAEIEIEVSAIHQEGMVISVKEGIEVPTVGNSIEIKVIGAKGTVEIKITDENGTEIESLEFPASSQGEINMTWIIPKDTVPGKYTISAEDAFDSAETTYIVE
ncbi:biofilm-associated protein [Nitrosopumilus sp. K4]|uniref:biofilm-associated protein n=1 Tax=Nitrosopumilus sp. K4 TaxID=2795383 RepID=UPI001BA7AA84|nr:biofilm-associated protein [Nitrosopumilus sp. K4]QUC64940.1 biofilm-associated protein [Nitrosopumilus sp. K4]